MIGVKTHLATRSVTPRSACGRFIPAHRMTTDTAKVDCMKCQDSWQFSLENKPDDDDDMNSASKEALGLPE